MRIKALQMKTNDNANSSVHWVCFINLKLVQNTKGAGQLFLCSPLPPPTAAGLGLLPISGCQNHIWDSLSNIAVAAVAAVKYGASEQCL